MGRVLDNASFTDVDFTFEDGRKLHAHRCILCARVEYFSLSFQSQMGHAASDGTCEVRVEPIAMGDTYRAFQQLLKWAYTGELPESSKAQPDILLEVLQLADFYRIPNLALDISRALSRCLTKHNVLSILEAADRMNASQLRRTSFDFVLKNFEEVKKATDCFEEFGQQVENAHLIREIMKGLAATVARSPGAETATGPHD